jgi:hypothetical protein
LCGVIGFYSAPVSVGYSLALRIEVKEGFVKQVIKLIMSVTAGLLMVVGPEGVASAQLLDPTNQRCANAIGVSEAQAQARYAWAFYCRSNPGMNPPIKYLSDQSVVAYNDPLNAPIRPRLFPTYYDFLTADTWDVPDNAGTNCMLLPASAFHAGLCVTGCYEGSTALRFSDGDMSIRMALQSGKIDLVTLAEDSTLDNLQFIDNRVQSYTVDRFEEWQEIYTLTMKSGGQLRVTGEHPLLTSDGVMNQAQRLRPGNALIRADGSFDPILEIDTDTIFGKVYNIKPITTDYVSNVVVAGGYLNGSQRYQNEFLDTVNTLILRRALAEQADQIIRP